LLSTIRRWTTRSSEDGQVLVLFAGAIVTLLIIAALVFDVGMTLVERRDEQNAADAAALAGARYIFDVDCVAPAWTCTKARDAALRTALGNGFDNADAAEDVVVHIPPTSGRYIGLPNFIEVDVQATRPAIFGGVIGRTVWPVGVFAVATNDQNLTFPFSMLALSHTACKAMQVSGSGTITAFGSLQSNSDGSDCPGDPVGFSRTGGGDIDVIADDSSCRSVGEIQDQGTGEMTCTKDENSFALPDPLKKLDPPTTPALAAPMLFIGPGSVPSGGGNTDGYPKDCPGDVDRAPSVTSPQTCKLAPTGAWGNKAWVLYPGLYPGGLEITAGTTAYLMPGVYWIGGGGIRVANDGSIISIGTESDATTSLPTHATWAGFGGGILIYNSTLPVAGGAGGPIVFDGSSSRLLLHDLDLADTDPNHIYNNMVIFQDRTVTSPVTLNGSTSEAEVEGIIYVPAGEVKLNGNGGSLTVDEILADTFLIDGNGGSINVLRRVGVDAVIIAAGLVD
jgi:hypothetical protein